MNSAVASSGPAAARGEVADAERLAFLRGWGDTPLVFSTFPREMEHFVLPAAGYVAFVRWAGVKLVLGDPVGPPDARTHLLTEFVARHPASAFVAARADTA